MQPFVIAVWINAYGRADSRGLLQSVSRQDYIRYVIYLAEQNWLHLRHLQSSGSNTVIRETLIIDLEHLSAHQLSYKLGNPLFFFTFIT